MNTLNSLLFSFAAKASTGPISSGSREQSATAVCAWAAEPAAEPRSFGFGRRDLEDCIVLHSTAGRLAAFTASFHQRVMEATPFVLLVGHMICSSVNMYLVFVAQHEVEMAIASAADFFVAFGDGLIQGHVSMPSLLVLQMRSWTSKRKEALNRVRVWPDLTFFNSSRVEA